MCVCVGSEGGCQKYQGGKKNVRTALSPSHFCKATRRFSDGMIMHNSSLVAVTKLTVLKSEEKTIVIFISYHC